MSSTEDMPSFEVPAEQPSAVINAAELMRSGDGLGEKTSLGFISLKVVNEAINMDGIMQGKYKVRRGGKGRKKAEVRTVRSLTFRAGQLRGAR